MNFEIIHTTNNKMDIDFGCIRQRTAPMIVKRINTYPPSTLPIEKSFIHQITPHVLPPIVGVPATSSKVRKSHYKVQKTARSSIKIEPLIQPPSAKLLKKIESIPVITPKISATVPEKLENLLEINSTKADAENGLVNNEEVFVFKIPVVPASSCVCGRDTGDDMIGCNGPHCSREWFHISCVGLVRRKVKYMSSWYCRLCSNKRR